MIKILTIIGARPQIIKAAAISRVISTHFASQIQELIVHTGQHYDENMSEVFFTELGIPKPYYNLNVGSSSHAVQTAAIMQGIESIIQDENPHGVIIYGDTNSTIAAALAAVKIHIPIFHIEAGLRSYNKSMPEEVNRVLSDHISTLLFCPTNTAVKNLVKEGFSTENFSPPSIDNPHVYQCGDIMYDNSLFYAALSDEKSTVLNDEKSKFILVTIHRDSNTDSKSRLTGIFEALLYIQHVTGYKIILPIHPRTKKMMQVNLDQGILNEIEVNTSFKLIPPAGFLDIIALEKNAELIITDSGGLQKEAYFFKKPCVILRSETEWVEIVENGNALIADADKDQIVSASNSLLSQKEYTYPLFFGDGNASYFIVDKILKTLGK
jgi:UDP-GlcNAc3NAcA epimerase